MMPYERLEAWRKAHELVTAVYGVTRRWPRDELYGLTAQTRRAAFSIPLNIAEGAAKKGSKEFRRFLDIAWGSHSELSYCPRLGSDLGYLSGAEQASLEGLRITVGKLTWSLYAPISRAANQT